MPIRIRSFTLCMLMAICSLFSFSTVAKAKAGAGNVVAPFLNNYPEEVWDFSEGGDYEENLGVVGTKWYYVGYSFYPGSHGALTVECDLTAGSDTTVEIIAYDMVSAEIVRTAETFEFGTEGINYGVSFTKLTYSHRYAIAFRSTGVDVSGSTVISDT